MKKITKLLIIIGILFIIAGCNNNNSDNEYVLKFETNTSVKLEDRVYKEYKSKIGELPTVTKEGYTFIGWYVNPNFLEGTEVTSETLIGKNITIYVKFEPNKYRINYDLDGGTVADGGSFDFNDNIKHYDEILTLPRLEKENYLFLGWEDPNNKLYKTEIKIKNDLTLKAKYISKEEISEKYEITYVMGDAKFYKYYSYNEARSEFLAAIGNGQKDFSESKINERLNGVYFVGKVFSFFERNDNYQEWAWILEYIKDLYEEAALKNPDANDALYIHKMLNIISNIKSQAYTNYPWEYWDENVMLACEIRGILSQTKYTSADENYSSMDYSQDDIKNRIWKYIEINSQNIYEVGKETILLIPKLEGKVFKGWYTNPEFTGEAIEKIDSMTYGNITLYAKFI